MTNDEYWTMNNGGEGWIGEKYREMAKDRSKNTRQKAFVSGFEMHALGRSSGQRGQLRGAGYSARTRYRVGGDSTTLARTTRLQQRPQILSPRNRAASNSIATASSAANQGKR